MNRRLPPSPDPNTPLVGVDELEAEAAVHEALHVARHAGVHIRADLEWALRWLLWDYDRQAVLDA